MIFKNTPANEALIEDLVKDIEEVGELRKKVAKLERRMELLTQQRNEALYDVSDASGVISALDAKIEETIKKEFT